MKQSTLTDHEPSGVQCPTCEKYYADKRGLGVHHSQAHDIKLSELDREGTACPKCGKVRQRLADHWGKSSTCSHPAYTPRQRELITGMLLGDGCVAHDTRKKNRHDWFIVQMTNFRFLEWLRNEFGVLATDVRQTRSAEKQLDLLRSGSLPGEISNANAVYEVTSRSHPELAEFRRWYDSGSKQYPEDLRLTPLIAKMWYVSDGCLAFQGHGRLYRRSVISINSQAENHQDLIRLFNDVGFDPSYRSGTKQLVFDGNDTEGFLEWLGEPPDGFEYKFISETQDEYTTLRSEAYAE